MGSGVTIYDIAREADISPSTVSRVLNGSALVSDVTSTKIQEIASRLGYEPRRIKRHASRAILHVVVFLPQAERPQSHLFYDAAELFSGIQGGFGDLRAHLIVSLNNSIDPLMAKKLGDIDGCIFAFSSPSATLRRLLSERQVPTVLINRVDEQFSYVANDAEAGMSGLYEAVNRARPGEPTCYVSVEDARPVADYRGRAIESLRGEVRPVARWVPTVSDITTGWVASLYEEGFRVLMCVNDTVAAAVYDRLSQLGIRVPEDVGVTGYDSAPVRGLLSKAITTVDLSVAELGWQASDLLGRMIVDRDFTRIGRSITGTLIPGDTL